MHVNLLLRVMDDISRDPEVDPTLGNLKLALDLAMADIGLVWEATNDDILVDRRNKINMVYRYVTSSPLVPPDEALKYSKGKASNTMTAHQRIGVHRQQDQLRHVLQKATDDRKPILEENWYFYDEVIFDSEGRVKTWGKGVVKSAGKWMVLCFVGGPSLIRYVVLVDTRNKQLHGRILQTSRNTCIFISTGI